MTAFKKRPVLFCIHKLGGGGAEKLLIDVLRKMDHTLLAVDLYVLSGEGLYLTDIPEQVRLAGYADFMQKEYDVEVAFLEGLATRAIALRQSAAVKIAWVHTDLYTNHFAIDGTYRTASEEALCYSMMDQIVFVSHTGMKQFDRLFPGIHVNKKVIYNLIDKKEILSKSQAVACPIAKTKPTLCSIGRLFPEKGFDRLIPILSRLKRDGLDFHYWMIGDGPQKELILNLIEQHNLEDTVFLPGFHKNPHPYLKAADVFISVSRAEGFSLVTGEALCLGKPVIATRVTGITEILDDGKYGMLVDTDDESIYTGLKAMLSDESLRKSFAQKAETGSTTDIFDIQKNIHQINDLLYHTASGKTPLNRIAHYLFIDDCNSNDPGLLYGKMGKAIFFFHCAALTGNRILKEYATELIDEMIRLIYAETPADYETGLAGMGVGIEYLVQRQFIDGSANEILEDFDRRLRKETWKDPVSDFSLLNGYMGYARYWMFRLSNPENKKIRKNSRIIKSLNHILSVIDTHLPDIEPDDEKQDIYRFLCDLKQFTQFTQQADSCLDKHFDSRYFHEHDRQNFGHTKSNPVNTYIWECFDQPYFEQQNNKTTWQAQNEIPLTSPLPPSKGEWERKETDADPNQFINIIRDELFVFTFNQQDNSSALRPVALKVQRSQVQHKSKYPDMPIVDVHTHPRRMMDVTNLIKVSETIRQGYGANLAFWIGLTPPPVSAGDVKAACNNRMLLAVDEMEPQKGLTVTAEEVIAKIREGYVGLKFWFGNPQRVAGSIIHRIDDPGYASFFSALERENVLMTSLHIADPNGPFTDRQEWMSDPVYFWAQIKAFENVVANYPKLTIIAAHGAWLVCQDAQIDHLRYMLSTYPNLYIDLAATFQYIPLVNRDNLRDFYIEYQDRILYGTDAGDINDESINYVSNRYVNTFLILETDQTVHGGFFGNLPTKGFNLPGEILEKIYYKNALQLYPGLKEAMGICP